MYDTAADAIHAAAYDAAAAGTAASPRTASGTLLRSGDERCAGWHRRPCEWQARECFPAEPTGGAHCMLDHQAACAASIYGVVCECRLPKRAPPGVYL